MKHPSRKGSMFSNGLLLRHLLTNETGHIRRLTNVTHWGRVTHICVNKLTIIGSDTDLSSGRRQAIIWTNAGILLIGPLETNFSDISIEIHIFPFKKMHFNMSSGNWQPFCLGLNVLSIYVITGTNAILVFWILLAIIKWSNVSD